MRFRDSGPVFRTVSAALAEVLGKTPWLASDGLRAPPLHAAEAPGASYRVDLDNVGAALGSPAQADLLGTRPRGPFSALRPVGQVLGVYIVAEGPDGLVLIDQHAAHERVTFERMRKQAQGGSVERQPLLFPDNVEVRPEVESLLAGRAAELVRLGFEIEPVGPRRLAVRAVPAALAGANSERLLGDLLEELEAFDDLGDAGSEATASVLSRCACHAAVRAGDTLSTGEIAALLEAMDEIDFGANCPHGRPVYHRISRVELDRIFHRS